MVMMLILILLPAAFLLPPGAGAGEYGEMRDHGEWSRQLSGLFANPGSSLESDASARATVGSQDLAREGFGGGGDGTRVAELVPR